MATTSKNTIRTSRIRPVQNLAPASRDGEFLTGLGLRVRTAREERGLSRRVLAEAADVSERYLAQLESGEGNASVILLRRVAKALGMRLTDLLDADQSAALQRINRLVDGLPARRHEEVLQKLISEFGTEEGLRRKRIALIGLRGAGKTTLGTALAKELRRPFIELDAEIARDAGMPLSEIFLLYGASGYRGIERRCLLRLVNSQSDIVISVGGGVVSDPETYQVLLANCYTVWIKASPSEHMSRVIAQGDMRPMKGHAQAMDDLKAILAARDPLYARADKAVDTSGESVEKSLAALRRAVTPRPA
jgi:XRE family transcriptional regulator, aerobic/anaerobic benzoate catabolism transcriptional regulator